MRPTIPGRDDRDFVGALLGDGRPLLVLTALALLFSGGFALFLSATWQFLPHDIRFLHMTAEELCALKECRVAAFMFHDRVAFGGSLLAIGVLYLWLAEFPLRAREAWAWWLFAISGSVGFLSFLAYLGYGYLDSWHGTATLLLLPCFALGLWRSHAHLRPPRGLRTLATPGATLAWRSPFGLGRALLLATGGGMVAAGLVILVVGMTRVFVPSDLAFMAASAEELGRVNPRLVPLIAHDRAGFGGGLVSCGLLVLGCVWRGAPSRSLWQALAIAGTAGFGCALGVHFVVGYRDTLHLAPAVAGTAAFAAGWTLCVGPGSRPTSSLDFRQESSDLLSEP